MDYDVFLERPRPSPFLAEFRAVGEALGRLGVLPLIDAERRTSGNVSARTGSGFTITGAGVDKIDLRSDALVEVLSVDEVRSRIRAAGTIVPSSEVLIHFEVYRRFRGVHAIIHVHDDRALAAWDRLGVPQTETSFTAATASQARALADLIEARDARYVQIRDHGQFAIGASLDEALQIVRDVHTRARRLDRRAGAGFGSSPTAATPGSGDGG